MAVKRSFHNPHFTLLSSAFYSLFIKSVFVVFRLSVRISDVNWNCAITFSYLFYVIVLLF